MNFILFISFLILTLSQLPQFPQQFKWKYNFQDTISGTGHSEFTWDFHEKRNRQDTLFTRGQKRDTMIARYDLHQCCGQVQWYWKCWHLNACSKRILVPPMRPYQIAGNFRGKDRINGIPVDHYFYKFSSDWLKQETDYWIATKDGHPYPLRVRRRTLPGSHPSNPVRTTISDTIFFTLTKEPESFYHVPDDWNCEFISPEKCKPATFLHYQSNNETLEMY